MARRSRLRWLLCCLVTATIATLVVHRHLGLEEQVPLTQPLQSLSAFLRHTESDHVEVYDDHVEAYDVEEVLRWYKGSTCSTRRKEFVGDRPLFPPCSSNITAGVATWGKHPYVGPFEYEADSKNPCWYDHGQLRCVPYFYIIGVSKSGTSDLFARIVRHPDVLKTKKEVHWFDRFRYETNEYKKFLSFTGYTSKYRSAAQWIRKDIKSQGRSVKIVGDGSPSYFYDNYEWPHYSGNENCTEPRVLLANHIRHLFPDVKVILIIRHPVNRLYSRYQFDYFKPKNKLPTPSPEQFHAFVSDGLSKYRACFERWSLRHCVYNKSLWQSVHELRIQESIYPVMLEDWLRVIPREQILFIRFEDFASNMTQDLMRVHQFLGLRPLNNTFLQAITSAKVTNAATRRLGPMLPETQRLLHDFYQPFVRRLASLIGDKKFLWPELQDSWPQ